EAAMHLAERLQGREVSLAVGDIDRQAADVLGPAPGRAHDLQHPLERARPLLDEPGPLGGGLPGHEQDPPPGRGEQAVIPAARSAERVGIDDAERHRWEPASAITTASPLVSLPAPWHSASTALATSSGGIRRRWPVVSRAARRASASDIRVFAAMRLIDCRVISVSTYPGQTALTVTPVPATSAATERVRPTTACFDALYAVMYLPPPSPATDAMFTTRPQPRASIPGRKAWVHRNGPVAFTVRSRFQSSSVVFCTGAEWLMPALFTRMSTWPSRVSASRARVRTPSGSETSHATAHARRPAGSKLVCPARIAPLSERGLAGKERRKASRTNSGRAASTIELSYWPAWQAPLRNSSVSRTAQGLFVTSGNTIRAPSSCRICVT